MPKNKKALFEESLHKFLYVLTLTVATLFTFFYLLDYVEFLSPYKCMLAEKFCKKPITVGELIIEPTKELKVTSAKLSILQTEDNLIVYVNYTGDDNSNSECELYYRKKGTVEWNKASDMVLVSGEKTFTGMLFSLPENEYDIKVILKDPDDESVKELFGTASVQRPSYSIGNLRSYYVDSVRGSDSLDCMSPSTGTKSKPFKTISKAVSCVKPGETIYVYPGIYKESIKIINKGTSDNPNWISIIALSDLGDVVLDGSEELPKDKWIAVQQTQSTSPYGSMIVNPPSDSSQTYYAINVSFIPSNYLVVDQEKAYQHACYQKTCKDSFLDTNNPIMKIFNESSIGVSSWTYTQYPYFTTIYLRLSDRSHPSSHSIRVARYNTAFSIINSHYIMISGFTFKNLGISGVSIDSESTGASTNIIISSNNFSDVNAGVLKNSMGGRNIIVYENSFVENGQSNWPGEAVQRGSFTDTKAISIAADSHVNVFRNKISGYAVCISLPGRLISKGSRSVSEISIHSNQLKNCILESIKLDYSGKNILVWNNTISDSEIAFSLSPLYYGPVYIFRNYLINVTTGFRVGSPGYSLTSNNYYASDGKLFAYHNTVYAFRKNYLYSSLKGVYSCIGGMVANHIFKNNVFLASEAIIKNENCSISDSEFDYNLHYSSGYSSSFPIYIWYTGTDKFLLKDFISFQRATSYEINGLFVENALDVVFKKKLSQLKEIIPQDLEPALNSPVSDKGVWIKCFNDICSRWPAYNLPDIGAHETTSFPEELRPPEEKPGLDKPLYYYADNNIRPRMYMTDQEILFKYNELMRFSATDTPRRMINKILSASRYQCTNADFINSFRNRDGVALAIYLGPMTVAQKLKSLKVETITDCDINAKVEEMLDTIMSNQKLPTWSYLVTNANKNLTFNDLSAAENVLALSIYFDWNYNTLSNQQKSKIKKLLYLESKCLYNNLMGREPFSFDFDLVYGEQTFSRSTKFCGGKYYSKGYLNGHRIHGYAAVFSSAVALYGEEIPELNLDRKKLQEELDEWISQAYPNFTSYFLNLTPKDGGFYHYFGYGTQPFVSTSQVLILMKQLLNEDYLNSSWIQNQGDFYLYGLYPGEAFLVEWGDENHRTDNRMKTTLFLNSQLAHQPIYKQLSAWQIYRYDKIWPDDLGYKVEDFILMPLHGPISPQEADLPTFKVFKDLGIVVMRSDWTENAFFATFKAGYPIGETFAELLKDYSYAQLSDTRILGNLGLAYISAQYHHDSDEGHFYLFYKNRTLMIGDGYGSGFGGWKRSNFHSVPLFKTLSDESDLHQDGFIGQVSESARIPKYIGFDGINLTKLHNILNTVQEDGKRGARPKLVKTESTSSYDYAVADLTFAYPKEVGLNQGPTETSSRMNDLSKPRYIRHFIRIKDEAPLVLVVDDIKLSDNFPERTIHSRFMVRDENNITVVAENSSITFVYPVNSNMVLIRVNDSKVVENFFITAPSLNLTLQDLSVTPTILFNAKENVSIYDNGAPRNRDIPIFLRNVVTIKNKEPARNLLFSLAIYITEPNKKSISSMARSYDPDKRELKFRVFYSDGVTRELILNLNSFTLSSAALGRRG